MCNDASILQYEVPKSARYVTIQVHDNFFSGDKDCGYNDEDCCSGGYSPCGISGVCEVTIDLNDCPTKEVPDCYTDEDCSYFNTACSYGQCDYGKCVNSFKEDFVQCRPAYGLCDAPEYCTGDKPDCPADNKLPKGSVCREATHACDYPEVCSGYSEECPPDSFKEEGEICREAIGECDITEVCTGDSPYCPPDQRSDYAYTFKCSTTQYLCGIDRSELVIDSNAYKVGDGESSCGIGTANTFVDLPYPDCLYKCLYAKCPNNRGLSNWSESHCDPYTGKWKCDYKHDVGYGTTLPYCFNWED
jgi:hypothetical protein